MTRNWAIRGWINYFRIGSMKTALTRIDKHLRNRMRIVIWKQWKTSAKRMWGLRKLGVPEWMARKSVGFGNHYQAVAKTAGLRCISKEILTNYGDGANPVILKSEFILSLCEQLIGGSSLGAKQKSIIDREYLCKAYECGYTQSPYLLRHSRPRQAATAYRYACCS